ncbi:lytic transglycosylase domain-containing protein [Sulfurovum sp. ST-21]|uniref:Lytic transglycosylase domain-containing protein n=1 Tax=Sulfurovum indicum TaxID=2779528 RepID=A0A7M1S9A5_9BACT|nr:lytic transglycosylase domain-containing protein [Sulfurovum indicum]QOR62910.1 lytic transglycosylase domain-containing protein [Sulfurovum indicum]
MKLHRFLPILLLVVLSTAPLSAKKTFNYSQVHRMPQSIEKDYYIWRFLKQPDTTASQARAIIQEVSHLNKKLKEAYRKKTGSYPKVKPKGALYRVDDPEKWKNRAQGNYAFRKAISLVQRKQLKRAAEFFNSAYRIYTERWEKDKALFWLYLVTKDKNYLDTLKQSYHINMYTLLAADLTKSKYPRTIITPNITKNSIWGIDAEDPIDWAKMKQKLFTPGTDLEDLAQECASKETIGMHTYIKARACNFTKSYFPMPYRDIMERYSIERQALIYAIARQESRFVPASVSRSFALGMMQFMPFLIDHVSKEKGERIDYDDIFDPYKAIEYADYHLDYLTTYLYHPLFIAYAYNGGIGFTRRLLRKRGNFRPGPFEPYLSMEKMTNVEAREYGKRVLTNYVVYMNKLGKPTRLLPFIKTLTDPYQTDRFRK